MPYCPHCMTDTDQPFCPNCHKPTAYAAKAGLLPPGTTPDTKGRYVLGKDLGQGGFGVTYVGLDRQSGKKVAIKEYFPLQCALRADSGVVLPKPGMDALYQGGRKSFMTEGQMLFEQREVPSVVQVRDYFEANNTAYIVMEYLEGVTLKEMVESGTVMDFASIRDKFHVLMCDLAKVHKAGVIHRDISPDNIMWMPDDTLKLLDFGAARSIENGRSMTVNLKPGFAPVEQYTSHGQGPYTDVYGLSATIYYCITGRVPPESPARMEKDELVAPSALGIQMDPEEEEALLWGLTVQPKNRPQDMQTLDYKLYVLPEQKRQEEEKRRQEELRKLEEQRKLEEKRQAEELRRQEEKRKQEEKRRQREKEKQERIQKAQDAQHTKKTGFQMNVQQRTYAVIAGIALITVFLVALIAILFGGL